eukprot:448441-Prymnesium_polylepis.1
MPHCGSLPQRRPEVNRSKDPVSAGIPSEELLQAAPRRLAAASSPLHRVGARVPDEVFGVQDVHDAYA